MKVTLTPEPNTERTDMTDLSADLALAESEARASRERVTVDEVMRLAYEYRWMSFDTAEKAESALRTAVEALVTEREAMKVALSALWFSTTACGALKGAP